jgi:hypothetical protein
MKMEAVTYIPQKHWLTAYQITQHYIPEETNLTSSEFRKLALLNIVFLE